MQHSSDTEPTPATPRKNVGRARGSILEAATRLFGSQGYAGTTMRDIATEVGVLPGSLYTHISGKETLLLEIVEAGIDQFLTLRDLAGSDADPAAARLRAVIKGHVEIVAENPQRTLVVFHQWRFLSGESLDRVVEKRQQYEALFTTLVEDGIGSGGFGADLDTKVAVLSVLGALNWTPEWYSADGPDTAEEIGDRLADTLLRGLQVRT